MEKRGDLSRFELLTYRFLLFYVTTANLSFVTAI